MTPATARVLEHSFLGLTIWQSSRQTGRGRGVSVVEEKNVPCYFSSGLALGVLEEPQKPELLGVLSTVLASCAIYLSIYFTPQITILCIK